MSKLYATAFQRHFSFFNITKSGVITPYQSLKALLSIGLDFPVALASALSFPLIYGNTGFLSLYINISQIPPRKHPTQLQDVNLGKERYTRSELLALLDEKDGIRWFDRSHLIGVWAMTAGTDGKDKGFVRREDLEIFKKGELMEQLKRRRKDRKDVLPLWRGGPISVAGHSWFVNKLFGVEVYQKNDKSN